MMSQLDVTDLLLDPDIAGNSIQIKSRRMAINDKGRASWAETITQAMAAVYPTGSNSLVREEAYETQTDTITVVTKAPISGPGKDGQGNDYDADQVFWRDVWYVVKSVNKFSYGDGFTQAECAAIDYNVKRQQE